VQHLLRESLGLVVALRGEGQLRGLAACVGRELGEPLPAVVGPTRARDRKVVALVVDRQRVERGCQPIIALQPGGFGERGLESVRLAP
jgi:hypothetical protein